MKIEQQVCNLELAKKLKELGIEQDSLYVFVDKFPIFNDSIRLVSIVEFKDRLAVSLLSEQARKLVNTYSAFTATELLEMLPESIDDKYLLEIGKENGEYIVYYVDRVSDITDYCFNKGQDDIDVDDKNLCNALAKMLIYLLENNLIKN